MIRRASAELSLIATIDVDLRELREQGRCDVVPVADGVVVDHQGLVGGRRDRAEVGDDLAVVAAVDHRRHDHEPVGAEAGAVLDVAACGRRARLGHAGQNGHTARGDTYSGLHDRALLVCFERLVLAQGAAHDEATDA